MKKMNMNPMRMCCFCDMSSMHIMMCHDRKRVIYIINKFKERHEYEKDYFYDSIDFRAAA